jgi:hypothetical protein
MLNGNRQRSLLLGLGQDLINAVAELLCAAFILLAAASPHSVVYHYASTSIAVEGKRK